MINYRLRCQNQHGFEGWFRSSADFDSQSNSGLLSCPICGDTNIVKAIMSPAVARRDRDLPAPSVIEDKGDAKPETSPAATGSQDVEPPSSVVAKPSNTPVDQRTARMWQLMRQVQQHVESQFENVGKQFTEEVRKMHVGETEHRDVYGEATLQDAKDLIEEGIDILPLPKLPKLDG